jgi:putative Mg2+ transporter-C (MgtC) family protein
MSLHLSWGEIATRTLLALLAGALVGFNRERGGHAAGLRTMILITLAACLAMIQANLLLSISGKTSNSFAGMDVLRLPLGVLTGVGFIGGGAILRRGNEVAGVTTAASIWIMTVVGLCFGGGLIWLGCIATAVTFIVVAPAKSLDRRIRREFDARITVRATDGADAATVTAAIEEYGCQAQLMRFATAEDGVGEFSYVLRWLASKPGISIETLLGRQNTRFTITNVEILSSKL